jgi:hypothetical protein
VMLGAWSLASSGRLRGEGMGAMNTEGLDNGQKNSIKIGNTWMPIDRADPVAMPLIIAANMYEGWMHGYDPNNPQANSALEKAAGMGLMALSRTLLERSAMQSLDQLFAAAGEKNPTKAGTLWDQMLAQQERKLVPFSAAVNETRQAVDPVARNPDGYLDVLRNMVPGFSSSLPARRDLLGDPIIKPDTAWWNPLAGTNQTNDPLRQKLADVRADIRFPPRQLADGTKLNPHQWDEIVSIATTEKLDGSKTLREARQDATESYDWKAAEASKTVKDGGRYEKALITQRVIDGYYKGAEAMWLSRHGRETDALQTFMIDRANNRFAQ